MRELADKFLGYIPGGYFLRNWINEEHEYRVNSACQSQNHPIENDNLKLNGNNVENGRVLRLMNGEKAFANWYESQYFMNKDGLAIFWRSWVPDTPKEDLKGIIILVHGLAEHSLRYSELGNILSKNGYAVYALDHQGMGLSEGTRLYVKSFFDFVDDVIHFTNLIKSKYHNNTISGGMNSNNHSFYILGHSMGALIAILAVQQAPKLYSGAIISSPPLEVDLPPFADKIAPILSQYFPKLPSPSIDLKTLCHDQYVVDRYMNDPLVPHDYAPKIRLTNGLVEAISKVDAKNFPLPYLLLHGTSDQICKYEGSVKFHNETILPYEMKVFKSVQDGYHELFNEPNRFEHAIKFTLDWLNSN